MLSPGPAIEHMHSVWDSIAERYAAYRLALPGSPQFICQANLCHAHCCHAFSVNLGESEVARMRQASALPPVAFLESEHGAPIHLPLAQPFLLKRSDNHCALLRDDLACGQYEGRPNACRLYPHFVLFIDPSTRRPIHADLDAMTASFEATLAGATPTADARCVPLLLRHIECPGFTGPPMSTEDWRSLFAETFRLQYEHI